MKPRSCFLFVSLLCLVTTVSAWDYSGHRIVNELALASMPEDFPVFTRAPENAARIAFLAGEPDRWRNTTDLPLKHCNGLNHYCDMEQVPDAGLDWSTVSDLRYRFAVAFANGCTAHPDAFDYIDLSKRNEAHTAEWPGFLPWTITEYYGKLKSAFSYLKTFEAYGTSQEVANAKENVIYLMGVMGHFVGDGAQPLHTTVHHNGWVGKNPHHYTRWPGFHSWVDGGFIRKASISTAEVLPRVSLATALDVKPRVDGRSPVFTAVVAYLLAQNGEVEPLYILEKEDLLKSAVAKDSVKGRAFIENQLLKGGEMLGALWLAAWRNAAPDSYLERQLKKRAANTP